VVFLVSALAGFLGELTGLGGGVAVTPVLTLLLGVDIHYANGGVAGIGDCDVIRRGGIRQGRILQRARGHATGDRGYGGSGAESVRRWGCRAARNRLSPEDPSERQPLRR
jgi:hypothetical protein